MHAVQGGGVEVLKLGVAVENGLFAMRMPRPWRGVELRVREERLLYAGVRVTLDPAGGGGGALLAEEVGSPLADRQQAHHAFLLADECGRSSGRGRCPWAGRSGAPRRRGG